MHGGAQGVDVRSDVDRVAVVALLGRHVVERPHHLARPGQLLEPLGMLSGEQGQSQIEDLDAGLRALTPGPSPRGRGEVAAREHQVRRLDVSVNQPVVVGILETKGGLADEFAGVGDADRSEPVDEFREIGPLDVLHH